MPNTSNSSVAILMGTYNGARFLREQLDSIIAQSHTDWRLLIRDDGSSDETIAIIEHAAANDKRIELIRDTDGNLGSTSNFSTLCEEAKRRGFEYFLFADQDDFWHPDKVALSLAALRNAHSPARHDMPLLLHTDLAVVDENRNLIDPSLMHHNGFHHVDIDPLRTLLVQNFVTGCSVACNRALIELAAPIPSTAVMHDHWLALCAATFGRLLYLPDSTLDYRQHQHNQIGTRRHTVIPNIGPHGLGHSWREGVLLLERRIAQAQSLYELLEKHRTVNIEAETSVKAFLAIFTARSRPVRLARAYQSNIRCQRGAAYNLLMYLQMLSVSPVRFPSLSV